MKTLAQADLAGKTVFYRPDYNVPLENGVIQDDFRIVSTFPTLEKLIAAGCKIVIGSHVGRPDGQEKSEFSMRPVAQRLADQYQEAHTVRLAHKLDPTEIKAALGSMKAGDILLLENLRYNPGEEANDPEFAKLLASLADIYVNDAFACDHRAHASIVGVPALIPGYAGLLVEKEVSSLGSIVKDPAHPFVVIMGGAKVSDKIEVITALAKVADTLLIGGAMANTFLLAKGEDISKSKAEADKVEMAKGLIASLGEKLVLATDYAKKDVDGGFSYMDIGPKAIEQFQGYLGNAKTIFWNGSLGYAEDPKFAIATQAIAKYIGSLKGVTSVVAGGDTVETISTLKLHDQFTFISTGGGAALEFLAGTELPGIKALE
jgi:3-phosphoglycerate kinase